MTSDSLCSVMKEELIMDQAIKGKLAFMHFKLGNDEVNLSAICPEGWKMSDRDEGKEIIYSKSKNEITVRLFRSEEKKVFPKETHATKWYKFILNEFLPTDINYDNVSLEAFTSECLNDAYIYSAFSVETETERFLRHDYIVLSPSKILVVKADIKDKDSLIDLVENFVLSIGYEEKDKLRKTVD